MNTYYLKKDYKYVIYGAAFMGKFVLDGLQKAGYKVEAFLDKRAEVICEVEGIPVFHPKQFVNEDKGNTVVVVAITNPFEHPMVAKLLVDMGYRKIVYKMSADNQYQSDYAQNLFDTSEEIINGLVNESTIVFEYEDDFKDIYFENKGVIKETKDEVAVYVPVELCYTCLETDYNIPMSKRERNSDAVAACNKPILYCKWIINLFRGFEGYGNVSKSIHEFREFAYRNPEQYNTFPRTKQGIDDLITNRYTAFVQMSQLLNTGMEFFINTPIEVAWNAKGYFNIRDGVHRVCFFIAKGLTRIPAKMTRTDYENWINADKLKACIDFLRENECPPAYTPIPHPNFYNYPTYRDMAGIQRIQHITEYFINQQNIDVSGSKILEIGSFFSYFAQFFYRMGADVTTVEEQKNSFELGRLFNELLYCDGIKALLGDIEKIDLPETYDITIMLTVLYPYMETEKGKNILRKIDTVTEKLLLWESGDEPEKEKEIILKECSFKGYTKIAETYGTGKSRELGVFYKE